MKKKLNYFQVHKNKVKRKKFRLSFKQFLNVKGFSVGLDNDVILVFENNSIMCKLT